MTAADRHDHFDVLAVSHVLGGLEPEDAATFRSHLVACDTCRRRVAELRGIAADLAAAEREERARITTKTAVVRRDEPGRSTPSATRSIGMLVAVGLGVTLLVGLLFWGFHLRQVTAAMEEVAEVRESVLAGMATGRAVGLQVHEPVEGQVVIDDRGQLLGTLAGLPITASSQHVVAWLLGPDVDGVAPEVLARTPVDVTAEGLGAFRLSRADGSRLVVSLESGPVGRSPQGRTLAEATLS